MIMAGALTPVISSMLCWRPAPKKGMRTSVGGGSARMADPSRLLIDGFRQEAVLQTRTAKLAASLLAPRAAGDLE
jgi:hypothetical protein